MERLLLGICGVAFVVAVLRSCMREWKKSKPEPRIAVAELRNAITRSGDAGVAATVLSLSPLCPFSLSKSLSVVHRFSLCCVRLLCVRTRV